MQAGCLDMLGTSDFLINYVFKTQQMSIHGQMKLVFFLVYVILS